MKFKRIILSVLLLLVTLAVFACTKKITVSLTGDTKVKVGETIVLKPDASVDATFTWKSSDDAVATVKDGTVTGVAAGTATITVTAKSGNKSAEASLTITVEKKGETPIDNPDDNHKPVINGATDKVIQKGSQFVPLAGITAWDEEDGDLTTQIKCANNVRTGAVGEYTVTYTVKDSDGNVTSVTIKVTVVFNDSDAPLLAGVQNKTIIIGDIYFTLLDGVIANDAVDGDVSANIKTTGTVDVWTLGEYTVEYSVKDNSGNEAKATRKITVGLGEFGFDDLEDKTFEKSGKEYSFGLSIDAINTDLVAFALGKLELKVNAAADVKVVPTITNGDAPKALELKKGDNTLTVFFRINSPFVDGKVTLTLESEVELTISEAKFALGEAKDRTAPEITVPSGDKIVLPGSLTDVNALKTFVLNGVSAQDNVDGIITSKLDVDFSGIEIGNCFDEKEVTIFAVDSSGNKAEVKRTVQFVKVYDTKIIADPEFNTPVDPYNAETHIGWGLNGGGGNPELTVADGMLIHHNTTTDNPGWDSASSPFYRTTTEVLAAHNWYMLKFDVKAAVARKMTVRIGLETTEALGWIENFSGANNTPFNLTTEWQTCYVLFYIHAEQSQAKMPVIKFELKIGTFTWGGEEQGNTVYFDNLQVYLLTNENTAPKLTINTDLPTSFGKGEAKPDLTKYVIAYDREDAEYITITAANITESVDMSKPGTYEVIYKVGDSEGKESQIALRIKVLEEKDTVAPVLAEAAGIVKEYDQFSEAPDLTKLITATDNVDGDITITKSMIDAKADINVAGEYEVKYTVRDSSGNESTLTLTLVVKDKEAPKVSGKDTIKTLEGEALTAADILATLVVKDNVDGYMTLTVDAVKGLDQVDFNTPGEYPITVEATDSNGNTTVFAITVIVRVNGATTTVIDKMIVDLGPDAADKAESCTVEKVEDEYKITIDSLGGWASANKIKYAGIELTEGNVYVLKFVAKADEARQVKMNIGIGLWADPWMDHFTLLEDTTEEIEIGTSYAEYIVMFKYDKSFRDSGPTLEFCVGPTGHDGDKAGNTIYFKELAIYSTKEVAAEVSTEVKDFLADEYTGEHATVTKTSDGMTINPEDVGEWASFAKIKITNLPVEDGKTYELVVTAKADEARQIQFNIGVGLWADPWMDKYTLAEDGSNVLLLSTTDQKFVIRFTVDKASRDGGPTMEFCVGNTYHDGDKAGNVIYVSEFKLYEIEKGSSNPIEVEDPATAPIVLDDFESYTSQEELAKVWAKRYDGVNYTEGFELVEEDGKKLVKFTFASDKKYLLRFIGTFPELTDDYKYIRFKAKLPSEETQIEVWAYWNGSQNGFNFTPKDIYCEKDGYYYVPLSKWNKHGSDITGFAIGYNYKAGEVAYFDIIEYVVDQPDAVAPVITVSNEVKELVAAGLVFDAGTNLTETFNKLRDGLSATDDKDGEIAILDSMIDLGGLNLQSPYAGIYTITVTVPDEAGNKAVLTLDVTIKGSEGLLLDLYHRELKGENATVEEANGLITINPSNVGEWASYAKIKITNLGLEFGKAYELRIKAKADEVRQIQFNIGIGLWADPWMDKFTLSQDSNSVILLSTEMTEYVIKFTYDKQTRDGGPIIEFCVGNTYHAGDKAGNVIYVEAFGIYEGTADPNVDLTAPVISINPLVVLALKDKQFREGDNLEQDLQTLMNGVSATDDKDGAITLTSENFDLGGLDPKSAKAGTYTLTVTVSDSSGNVATQSLNVHVSKDADLTIDWADGTVGSPYNSTLWTREKYTNDGWVAITGNMNCREKDGVRVVNFVSGYSIPHKYTYTDEGGIGIASKITFKVGNYFGGADVIPLKVILVDYNGVNHYIVGSQDEFFDFSVTTGLVDQEFTFENIDVEKIVVCVNSKASASAYLYVGPIHLWLAATE